MTCDVVARLAREPDGTMYLSTGDFEAPGGFLFRIAPGGSEAVVLREWPDDIVGVAVGPDGSVYFSTTATIERLEPNGRLTRVAGNGQADFGGDGVATDISLAQPGTVTVGPDGSVYFLEGGMSASDGSVKPRVRRVSAAGTMTTIGGGVELGEAAREGGQAVGSPLDIRSRSGLALSPDGDPYVVSRSRIRRITPAFGRGSETDLKIASGNEIYEFSPDGRHLRTRDALTAVVVYAFGYDAAGRLIYDH